MMRKVAYTIFIVLSFGLLFSVYLLVTSNTEIEKVEISENYLNDIFPNKLLLEDQTEYSTDKEFFAFHVVDNLSMRNSEIWLIDRFGENLTNIAKGDEYRYFTTPKFSPDSERIAYARVYPFELWVYDIESSINTKIYDEKDYEEDKSNVFNPKMYFGGKINLQWDDNHSILFENYKAIPPEIVRIDINSLEFKTHQTINESKATSATKLKHFSQRDSVWGNEQLGGCAEETIHSAGCAVSAIAMVVDYFDKDTNPSSYNSFAIENFEQGYIDGCYVRWNIVQNYNEKMVLKGVYFNEFNTHRLDYELSLGNPVIIGFNSVPYTNIPHWVVVVDKTENDYVIYDPWDHEFIPRNLNYYGGSFDHMIVYTSL